MDFLFSGDDILWKPSLQSRGRPKFLKHLVSARRNRVLFFFQAVIRMEVAFRSSKIAFFRKSFVLASGNGFFINCKLYAFIRSFSLLVDTILEIRCKPIFFHFFIPNLTAEAVFRDYRQGEIFFCLVETYFWMKPSFQLLEKDFSLVEHVTLFERFFLLAKTDVMSGDQFLNTELILAGGNWFSG